MPKLTIKLPKDGEEGQIVLLDNGQSIKEEKFSKFQMAETLLEKIAAILESQQLRVEDIEQFDLETDLPDNYTGFRIAKTTVDTLKWVNNRKNQESSCG